VGKRRPAWGRRLLGRLRRWLGPAPDASTTCCGGTAPHCWCPYSPGARGDEGQFTTCTTSPRPSEPKKVLAALPERWMQPCESTARLPWWNAMPLLKNTE
jgi:hypothetical protein